MTAIALAVGKDGIALAADGRAWDVHSGATVLNNAQKIFPLAGSGAFAVTGWAASPSFTIAGTAQKFTQHFSQLDFSAAMVMFAIGVNCGLALARSQGRFPAFPEREDESDPIRRCTVARILVVTPIKLKDRLARMAVARLYHRNQELQDPIITQYDLSTGGTFFTGSDKVAAWLYGERGERKPIGRESSLQDAIKCASQYVETCGSPPGAELDPWCRDHVGGHMHIAVLSNGQFRWKRPPLLAR